jgi:hypothetical protein
MHLYAQDGVAAGYWSPSGKEIQAWAQSLCPLWLWGQHVFTWQGEHVGFWVDGWLRDHDGRAIAWSESASSGPPRPNIQPLPSRRAAGKVPTKVPTRGPLPPKPEWLNEWSTVSAHAYLRMFMDDDGESVPMSVGVERFRAARGAVAAPAPVVEPEAEPVVQEEEDPLLVALNQAISAYAAATDVRELRPASYRLSRAASAWARERNKPLRT